MNQRGVALVITLIMLSVITFLTVAFLTLSRRERGAATTAKSQTDAILMRDMGLARAQAELTASIMAQNNMLVNDLVVSRNYIRKGGFFDQGNIVDTNNVNYDYHVSGQSPGDVNADYPIYNIANLFFDPRPPVFVSTNAAGSNDFRFYLDLNRNGRFETNGFEVAQNDQGQALRDPADSNKFLTNNFVGDPEWIGVLEKPELPHSPTNRFVGRYAYIALPEGKSLDANMVHNYAKGVVNRSVTNTLGDYFMRNQGVGSWELNLAGFFYYLNTNYWGWGHSSSNQYVYNTNFGVANTTGPLFPAFSDAVDFVGYRYNRVFHTVNLPSVNQAFGNLGGQFFETDDIDGAADGPIAQFSLSLDNETSPTATYQPDNEDRPWSGNRSTNAYYDFDEFFDPVKTSAAFTNRLLSSAAQTNSYDRYTFYRMLSQMGTHSTPDRTRMNLNFDNLHATNRNTSDTNYWTVSATNFLPWTPIGFFTNAAQRIINRALEERRDGANNSALTNKALDGLLVGTNFGFTNIQVYPTNQSVYPAVHRLLQVAANLYGATTNEVIPASSGGLTNAPYIFRPQFSMVSAYNTNIIVISGYQEVTNDWRTQLQQRFLNLDDPTDFALIPPAPARSDLNVYGVPWVVSAKKGFPNFNEFTMETRMYVERKLSVIHSNTLNPTLQTRQLLLSGLTNTFGLELWNPYSNDYRGSVQVFATNIVSTIISTNTNSTGRIWPQNVAQINQTNDLNMVVPFVFTNSTFLTRVTNVEFMPTRRFRNNSFDSATNGYKNLPANQFPLPNWTVLTTNRFVFAMVDTNANRLLDFVNLMMTPDKMSITNLLYDPTRTNGNFRTDTVMWEPRIKGGTNFLKVSAPEGVLAQVRVSAGFSYIPPLDVDWMGQRQNEITNFHDLFYGLQGSNQAPYTPTMHLVRRLSFQANDPFIHYTLTDMAPGKVSTEGAHLRGRGGFVEISVEPNIDRLLLSAPNLGKINDPYNKYGPWGIQDTSYDLSIQDPQVRSVNEWDFPTNKFAGVGWIGRVHRGTPWQSIYLKSTAAPLADVWTKLRGSDATHPTNDWKFLDLFTAAPSDNAARGLLSVNQTNIAAWAAALAGVSVLTNNLESRPGVFPNANTLRQLGDINCFTNLIIDPAQIRDDNPANPRTAIQVILDGIINFRNSDAFRTNRPHNAFQTMGEVLAVPELTVNSPFLCLTNSTGPDTDQIRYGITDAAYERLPQQILSLLRIGEPRFVVYSFGQSLKPAENSILISAPRASLQNLCTNYQITGEIATRAVVRIDQNVERPAGATPRTVFRPVIEEFQVLPQQ